jgi:glycosyltransferase involved in cell wall biosynthesis
MALNTSKPRVLMIAYACDPNGGGEHLLGWGWAEAASKEFQVDLITTPRARAAVESRCLETGITPHFVEGSAWLRKITEASGGSWCRKLAWQKRATRLALSLHQERRFQLVHQTTFHTFRVPFLASGLGVPGVWGPIAGGEHVPPGFECYLGSARLSEASRNLTNRLWLRLPSIQRSLRQSKTLFISNHTTLEFLPSTVRSKCTVLPPNALRPEDENCPPPGPKLLSDTFKILYVGNCVATRAIPLVLDALKESAIEKFDFKVIGAGPALAGWRQRARELGMAERVHFLGKLPYQQLANYYSTADALVFPALRDSGGSAVLEAMARYLPVLCLDWGGPGEMVDQSSGIKVPVTTVPATVKAFAAGLLRLRDHPELRTELAQAARRRAESMFRWEAKRMLLEQTYQRLIAG